MLRRSFLALALLVLACAPAPVAPTAPPPAPSAPPAASAPAASAFPFTFKDDASHDVTFERPPQRIVSLSPGHTETLYAIGAGDKVVATDKYSDFPAENKPKATLVTYPKPNVEELVALKPDLIVTLTEGPELIQQVEPRGIKVLQLFPKTLDQSAADVEVLGRVTGNEAKAKQIAGGMRERAAAVAAKTKDAPKVRVLYELDASEPTQPFVSGPGSFHGSLIPLAGGKNVFDDINGPSGQVSAEQIIARDPEVIVLGDADSPYNAQTPDMVKARAGWQAISAVKNNKIFPISQDVMARPSPRLVEGLERLAKALHPELFP